MSVNLCFDTTSMSHRDAVRGERHPPHLDRSAVLSWKKICDGTFKHKGCDMLSPSLPATRAYPGKFTDPARWNAFKARTGDIVVVTPPKSGTTWTQAILALLISGDLRVDAETSMKSPWIDFNIRDLASVMARLEAQDGRRHVKTHTPLDGIPVWSELRYLTVYRHPIDVYFSFRKHAANQKEEIGRPFFPSEYFAEDPAEGFHVFLHGDFIEAASLSAITDHYLGPLSREPAENLLCLHYADMLRDLPGTFGRIAAHIGVHHAPDMMARLVDAATFASMKTNAHRFAPSAGQGNWKDDAAFFDSASSNKWVGRLSDTDIATYDARMAELLTQGQRRWLESGADAG